MSTLYDGSFLTFVRRYWSAIVVLVIGESVVLLTLMVTFRYGPTLMADSAVYFTGGKFMANGYLPYQHLWDIKPPAIYVTIAPVFYLTGKDPLVTYIIGVGLAAATIVGSMVLVWSILYHHTDNHVASLVGGVAPLLYTPYYEFLTGGVRVKHFMIFFCLLGLYFYLKDRPFASGASATLGTLYWQPGVLILVGVLLGWWRIDYGPRRYRRAQWSVVFGVTSVALVVTAPFVVGGATVPMIAQTVLAPFIDSGASTLELSLINEVASRWGTGWILPVLGGVGAVGALCRQLGDDGSRIWMITWSYFSLAALLLLDQRGLPDLIPLMIVSGIGVGIVIDMVEGAGSPDQYGGLTVKHVLLALVVSGMILSTPWTNGTTPNRHPHSSIQYEYYFGDAPPTCHVRRSTTEIRWVRSVDGDVNESRCWGSTPSEDIIDFMGSSGNRQP